MSYDERGTECIRSPTFLPKIETLHHTRYVKYHSNTYHLALCSVFNKTESPPCVPLPVRDAHRYEDRKRLSIQPFRCHLETDKTSSCHTEETQRDCLSLDGGSTYNDEMASQSREALDLAVGDLFVIGYHVPPICIWRWKSFDPHALKREFLTVEQRVFAWAAPRSTSISRGEVVPKEWSLRMETPIRKEREVITEKERGVRRYGERDRSLREVGRYGERERS